MSSINPSLYNDNGEYCSKVIVTKAIKIRDLDQIPQTILALAATNNGANYDYASPNYITNARKRFKARLNRNPIWYPKMGDTAAIFFARSDQAGWDIRAEVDEAILYTQKQYPHIDINYAVLTPVNTHDLVDMNLIAQLFAEDDAAAAAAANQPNQPNQGQ
ncbi:hypothetical protein DDB_G0280543 [Dictyostelium discoideum AX4]|uniref:Uncharacterized protein n=1 Tax=Dictyostelium discoideum TaxID=44689 RepID=Q54V27_DICDI|nr:hypothetical protein DDB_G0280543 [Dictyostelium discoideum AX4]EAL67073.1 hypothetical protein DDB_G0280543 [Dictyostelium discoideum AX4]|eukprot:XP_641104.1 hypothetical protein DDB_G0280543 [Dictyostelium discoideum AX4]